MTITWLDVVKLAVPFIAAILMVWIKSWIEVRISRKNKQHALSRLICDVVEESSVTIKALKNIAESAVKGNIRLVTIEVSTLISKFSCDLADLDAKQAYCYADLASSFEIVNKGLSRLSSLIMSRVSTSSDDAAAQLDRAIIGQAKITAGDYLSMGRSGLSVMKIIPAKSCYSSDPQAVAALEQSVKSAEAERAEWPLAQAQQGAPADPLASASLRQAVG